MENESELVQITTRLPLNVKEKIDGLAKSGGCSTAEIIRRSVDGSLSKYLDGMQYVDVEQGEAIKELASSVYTELSGMRTELHRMGNNLNQMMKIRHLENKFAEGRIDIRKLVNERQSIIEECKDFSPEAINEIMDRFDMIAEEFANLMAYTRISHTRNGRAAIQYARGNGRGHNGHAERNLLIGCVGMLPDSLIPLEEQMAEDWERASGRNKNQVRRIVMSFSDKEIDPNDENSAYLALEMAQEFIEEAYPNRKAAIFVQNDGKGGKLHIHALVSNVDSIEHKGCTDEQTKFEYVKQNFNRVASRHITLDNGKKAKDKFSQTERALKEEAVENSGTVAYIWKDDLRERIQIAMENATSEDDFLEALEDEGVKARHGNSKRYGEYISYELVDVPPHMEGADRKYKARSYTLGDAYGVEALREKLREKYKDFFHFSEQRDHAAESKGDLSSTSQGGLHTEAAALAPVNGSPEMKRTPVSKSVDVQTVRDKVNFVIGGLKQDTRTETPIPAQSAHTAPPTAAAGAERVDSAPEGKQPVQSVTAPQTGKLSALDKMQRMTKQIDDNEAQKQLVEAISKSK